MLDALSPEARHLALLLLGALLAWGTATVPALGWDPLLASLAGAFLTAALAWFTPLTRQYGIGSDEERET